MIRAGVLTLSDKGAAGQRRDISGPLLKELLNSHGIDTHLYEIIPDDQETLTERLRSWSASEDIDLILTTGGTGVSPRDITPEATLSVIDQRIPGMEEAMRYASLRKTSRAMLSRAVCGIHNRTLIINLPGSPDGAQTGIETLLEVIPHAVEKIKGSMADCN